MSKSPKAPAATAPGAKDRIQAVPIFGKLNPMMLHRLSQAVQPKTFNHDDPIVEQGAPGDAMYIVDRGRCQASVEGVGVVKEFKPGEFFGEISLLTNEPRGA